MPFDLAFDVDFQSQKSKLDEDLQGKPVDATLYRVMIGSLIYLTSSRPDLIYAVCLCARYQAKPIEKHLNVVKIIFLYLKGTINIGVCGEWNCGTLLCSNGISTGLHLYQTPVKRKIQFLDQKARHKKHVSGNAKTSDRRRGRVMVRETPKPKYIRKKVYSDASPKQKLVQATKGTRIKTKDKVAKSDKKKQPAKKPKAKRLVVLSELKVHDEQQQMTSGTNEGTEDDDEDDFEDDADNNDEDSDGNSGSEDHDDDSDDKKTKSNRDEILDPNLTNVDQTEHEEENVDERVHTPSDYKLTDDEKIHDEVNIDKEEEDDVIKELYDDVNVN
uniref:Retrovirus-related Pol polyprotein from transposon TNT 1-94 n=1 Tax=Tanacetum cinerariifolium TaxID=118510 RepID=A0A6L2J646_TANCI|nr:hypothetical protein VITISV_036637 [Tanacetum cinerariifolium]